MLLSLTYTSKPVGSFDLEALNELWIELLEANEQAGITGALVFGGDYFFQTIEGEETSVMATWKRIKLDPRHTDINLLMENDVASRQFRIFPMKLVNAVGNPRLREKFSPETLETASFAILTKAVFRLAHI